jgi:polar amino acid transport system substrate-binding protein
MLSQDANVEIGPDLLPADVTISHYGIAIATEHPDFVRFVNRVLGEVRADGTWKALHERWLEGGPLDFDPVAPPQPRYRD